MFKHFSVPLRLLRKHPRGNASRRVMLFRTSASHKRDNYRDSDHGPSSKRGGRGFYYSLGAVVVGTGAVVAYAKYDDEFRDWLRENVPLSDEFISFVTAEETSHLDYIMSALSNAKNAILDDLSQLASGTSDADKDKEKDKHKKALAPCDEEKKPYKPAQTAFKSLASQQESKKEEQRVIEKGKVQEADTDKDKKKAKTPTQALADLEKEINENAEKAVKLYARASCAFRDVADDVDKLIEASFDKADKKIWSQLKQKNEEKEKIVNEAEEKLQDAMNTIKLLHDKMNALTDPSVSADVREKVKKSYERVKTQLKNSKQDYESEKAKAAVAEKYWHKIEDARRHFSEELETLFPSIRLGDKKLKLAESDFDLFILYAFQTILYLQKELSKLETVAQAKLKTAVEKSKLGDTEVVESVIQQEVEKEKRKIIQEYQKKLLEARADSEKDARNALKKQNEMHAELMKDALEAKEKEMERKLRREVEDKLMQEKEKYRQEVSALIGRLKGMDEAMRKRANQDRRAADAHLLWSASEALVSQLKAGDGCKKTKPLSEEIGVIKKITGDEDKLVKSVLEAIPKEASERGVFPEGALRDRYQNVERVAKRVALLPEGGASMPVMLLSFIQSLFIITPTNPIPAHELSDAPIEPDKLNTFEILQRARFYVDRGDWHSVLRYLNLLKGAPRVIAQDYLKELTIFLETKQAADVLQAHAASASLSQ